MFVMACG